MSCVPIWRRRQLGLGDLSICECAWRSELGGRLASVWPVEWISGPARGPRAAKLKGALKRLPPRGTILCPSIRSGGPAGVLLGRAASSRRAGAIRGPLWAFPLKWAPERRLGSGLGGGKWGARADWPADRIYSCARPAATRGPR